MAILSKAAILAARLKTETLAVPEWGGEVLVRELTAGERATFEEAAGNAVKSNSPIRDIRERLALLACVDESGASLFDESDFPALQRTSGAALARVADLAMALSGMTADEDDALEKN